MSFSVKNYETQFWLCALLVLQFTTEHFVFTYESSWAETSQWACEWGDYYSYWAHHLTTLSLIQILFPVVSTLPVIKHIDFVKIAIVALINTTCLWQGPKLGKYLIREELTYEFFINSLQHGGNLICLAMYVIKSGRSLRNFSPFHTLMLPLAYSCFIMYRVSTGRSTMRYYLPEGLGTTSNTALVGLMWITLQFLTELVVLQIIVNINRVPNVASRLLSITSNIRSMVLSPDNQSVSSWKEFLEQAVGTKN
mmetsp:Transcript_457/g.649  ORF Transcript_457/g.649 Transcript_457/m.649 type:complete len:252 (-) Transcript_457:94-849(-)|eukprot:CAMPEP_0171461090 /NCGR_PEP_ID=MMETSP0945-20130129/5685_1 /TAXON_ID=109269 /ORGANISM="Vaucheria litorea, Strain CCMP2940" /LENGTH=251 /DNA_ID=CAMNT_0011987383 /DNA_START=122 /DNA_END=877 /DNA_ORIENTATION=-